MEKVNLGVGKGLTQHVEVSKTTSRYFFTQTRKKQFNYLFIADVKRNERHERQAGA